MKKICVINPNTSTSMTNNIDKVAKSIASKDTEVLSINPKFGPESIEGYYDEAFCIPGIISEIRAILNMTHTLSHVLMTRDWMHAEPLQTNQLLA